MKSPSVGSVPAYSAKNESSKTPSQKMFRKINKSIPESPVKSILSGLKKNSSLISIPPSYREV